MGLEIFYDLHAPVSWTSDQVRRVVEDVREMSVALGFAEVDEIEPNDPDRPQTLCVQNPPGGRLGLRAKAVDGWLFRTWPGEGCETAIFGLCRFPGTVTLDGMEIPTGWGEGWHGHTWCKTQFADRVSREHFFKCHLGVIAILDAFRAAGIEVGARDGSGYWDHRDKARLAERLDEWNKLVAAVAGAFKDGMEGRGGEVVSPIFRAPDFEYLEAEGCDMLREQRGNWNRDSTASDQVDQ